MNIVSQEFEKLKDELIQSYEQKNMRASGEFATSLEVRETEKGAQLRGYVIRLTDCGSVKSSGQLPLK